MKLPKSQCVVFAPEMNVPEQEAKVAKFFRLSCRGSLTAFAFLLLLLTSCGVGLCVGGTDDGGCSILATPRLQLSGLEGLSIRKNDCYPVTLSAVDAAGSPMTELNASVTISASSGAVLYSSLQGCQTYDSAFERSIFALTPSNPSFVFYFRSDTEGVVSLSAYTTASAGLATATETLNVEYTAFDGAKGADGPVLAAIQDGNGKAYVGGALRTYDDFAVNYVARLNSDGTLDTSFAPTGSGLDSDVAEFCLQGDGKLLVGGSFTSYNGTTRPYAARLNSDGSLDASFAPTGSGLNDEVYALSLQGDGKLLVGGAFTAYNGTPRSYVARLNSIGTLDTSFALSGSGFNNTANAISLQSDGKVVVGGNFISYNGTARPRIARLNSDGTLDTTFAQTGSGLGNFVSALSLQSDGKVLVGGSFASYNGTSRPSIARLNSDGSLDTSFGPTGSGLDNAVNALSLQSDGKLLVGGLFTSYNGTSRPYVARLNSDGSLDTSFAPIGLGLNSTVTSLSLQSDGKLLVGGYFTSSSGRPYVARLNSDGAPDTAFATTGSGLNFQVYALSFRSDGKLLVGGAFTSYNGASRPSVARLNSDGTIDTGFAPTGSGLSGLVYALSLQSDDRPLVGGSFTSYNGTSRPYVARLNSDGTLDAGFAPTGSGLSGFVYALSGQSDGKVVVGGNFTSYNGTPRPYVARLNSDGTLDTGFAQTGSGLDGQVETLSLQSDGKVLVGGGFTSYNGTSRPYVARLNSDGTLDPSFAPAGSGLNGGVEALSLQSDGRLMAGGLFTSYNGTNLSFVARLKSDGTLDASFAPMGAGFNSSVYALAPQSDGKVVVGGGFTSYASSTVNYLVRLTYIGTAD